MKMILGCALVIASATGAFAQMFGQQTTGGGLYGTGSNPSSHYVQPHVSSNGGLVQGHYWMPLLAFCLVILALGVGAVYTAMV
jgi:hypothetical protein